MAKDLRKQYGGYLPTLQAVLLAEIQQVTELSDWARTNVLDVGCGSGVTTTQLAQYWPCVREVLGVDSNASAINYAFAFVADEKMDFAFADIEDQTTFDIHWAAKFDWVVSNHSMLFVREHSTALRNLMWCLKPGGRFFLAVPAAKPQDLHFAINKVIASDSWKNHFEPISEMITDMKDPNCNRLWFHQPDADRVYSSLVEQVGYQVLRTKLMDFRYIFSSDEEYKACLRCLLQKPLQCVPEEKEEIFLKEFHKAALKKAQKTAGGAVIWNVKYAVVLAKRPEQ